MKKILLISSVLIGSLSFCPKMAYAQNIAYVNSSTILAQLPDVKQAEANLEALQRQLQKKGQSMIEQLQKDYLSVQEKVEQGLLSPQQQETEAKKLEARQQEIAKLEQDMVQQIQDKRTELLEPIYTKVNTAINEVRKDKGYQMIFDQGVVIAAEDYLDVTKLVLAKLGL